MPFDHLHRPDLLERLDFGRNQPLILVSAPAGYGKSTLISSWLEGCGRPNGWLSLDENDDDLYQFLTYFLAAYKTMFCDGFPDTSALLQARELPPTTVLATTLVNEIERIDQEFIIVLDDIHRIKKKAIYDFLDLMLRHPPTSMQLVLVGRRDPVLPLSSMRARGVLTEVRMRDLRFTEDETVSFLRAATGYEVEKEITSALAQKTEGWITALRLAVLAMRGQENIGKTLLELQGTTRYVVDYLVTEVLHRQPAGVGQLLLFISILDRFNASLCEALLEEDKLLAKAGMNGQQLVDWLQSNNLFVIPLDTENQWFRYHHLFQQLLQQQLQRDASRENVANLHERACDWFESQGLLDEALAHALRGGHDNKAADIVEKYRVDLLNDDKWYVLESWFRLIPESVRETRPALLMADAWSAYERFQFDRLAIVVEKVAALLDPEATDPSVLGELSLLQGELQYWSGEGTLSRHSFEAARAYLPARHGLVRGLLELQYHLALCMEGDTENAIKGLDALIRETDSLEGIYLSRLIAGLYFVYHLTGNILRARVEAERLHAVATRSKIVYTGVWSSYMLACSYFHANELESALEHFTVVVRQRYILHTRAAVDAIAGMALTQQFLQRHEEASASQALLETFALELGDAQYIGVANSCRARLALLQGDLTKAIDWARSVHEETAPAALFMWLEVPGISQARVLIAEGTIESLGKATDLLNEVQRHSENCRFGNQVIECTLLQAMALEKMGHSDEAIQALKKVVALAESMGWVRPFSEAGPPIVNLLSQVQARGEPTEYVQRLLNACKDEPPTKSSTPLTTQTSLSQPPLNRILSAPSLVEPLSHRELDVLELLAQRLQNKEIATRLSISSVTVKSHLRNIFRKLQVSKRQDAVAEATRAGLLPDK